MNFKFDLFRAGKLKYSVDLVTGHQISGWVWSPKRPTARLDVELVEQGRVVGIATADCFRQDLKQAQIGDGAHSFVLSFPKELYDGEIHNLGLRVAGARRSYYNLPPTRLSSVVDYHIDGVTAHEIVGWAWLPGASQARACIEFLEGDIVLGSAWADRFRADLRDVGKGDGHCAFAFMLPPTLMDGRPHSVALRVKGQSESFHRIGERVYGKILGTIEVSRAEHKPHGPRLPMAKLRAELPSITTSEWGARANKRVEQVAPTTLATFDISIVLNVHREGSYLQRTLFSVMEAVEYARHRDGLTFELIVVLDNADEQTRAWAAPNRFLEFDSFKIVEVSNGSLGLSRNSGIAIASGKYVTTCDADDLVSFNMFSEAYSVAQRYDGNVVVFPEYLLAFGDSSHLCKYYDSRFIPTLAYFDYHPYISRVFVLTDYARSQPYKHADHRKDYAYEDWHFTSELVAANIPLVVAPNTTLYYRQRAGSLLREANATSSRLVHPNRLLEPQRFVELTKDWSEVVPDGVWMPPEVAVIRDEFFENPVTHASAYYANMIDPAVTFAPEPMSGIFTNLHGNALMGLAYRRACLQLLQRDYTDIVVLPFMTTGGGEKYILSLLEGLAECGLSERFLFLSGEAFGAHSWLELLPPRSDFIDLHEICNGDEHIIDVVTLRLIQNAGRGMRVHLKASGYAHRFIGKFGKLIQDNEVLYYRFCDELFRAKGDLWRDGSAFQAISENIGYIHRFISDHQALIDSDRRRFSTFEERWHCIYTKCNLPAQSWSGPAIKSVTKLLWASRVSAQKRPQLLLAIAEKLQRRLPDVILEVYGRCDPGQDVDAFHTYGNVRYIGPYENFLDLNVNEYAAFLYTSQFDGLPNVLLEAMGAGMPVIAPNVGGISEAVHHRETGWIVETNGDDQSDAERYVEVICEAIAAGSLASDIGARARAIVAERHSKKAFAIRVAQVFSPQV